MSTEDINKDDLEFEQDPAGYTPEEDMYETVEIPEDEDFDDFNEKKKTPKKSNLKKRILKKRILKSLLRMKTLKRLKKSLKQRKKPQWNNLQ